MLINGLMIPSAAAISSENLTLAWQTPLLGMVMVFAVLGLLWAVLGVFKLVFGGKSTKDSKPKTEPVKPVEPIATITSTPAVQQSSDTELVAILTAAVAAYMAEEGTDVSYNGGFRVVSFKRVRGGRTWNTK